MIPGIGLNGEIELQKGGPGSGPKPGNGAIDHDEITDANNGRYGRGNLNTPKSQQGSANGRPTQIGDKTRLGQSGPMTHEVVAPSSGSKEHFDLKPIVGGVAAQRNMRANYLHTMWRESSIGGLT